MPLLTVVPEYSDSTPNPLIPYDMWKASTSGLQNGNYVVTWTDSGGWAVRGRVFAANGTPLGGEFTVNANTTTFGSDKPSNPSVATLADGRFVVIWQGSEPGTFLGTQQIHARLFSADGTVAGNEFLVDTFPGANNYDPHVVARADGGFSVAWSVSAQLVATRNYDAAGAALGPVYRVDGDGNPNHFNISVTQLHSGNLLYTYTSTDTSKLTTDTHITARMATAAGIAIGPEFVIAQGVTQLRGHSNVITLANGGFLVTWDEISATNNDPASVDVHGQVFTDTGTKVGAEFIVNSTTLSIQNNCKAVALSDGRFAVVYESFDSYGVNGQPVHVNLRLFNSDGTACGEDFRVTTTTWAHSEASISVLANGNLLVTFDSFEDPSWSPAFRSSAVKSIIFDPNTFIGTDGNDTWIAGSANDTISGGGGDDTLMGGAGSDTLTGGTGDDRFIFNAADITAGQADIIADFTRDAAGGGDTVLMVGVTGSSISTVAGATAINVTYGNGTTNNTIQVNDGGSASPFFIYGYSTMANALTGNLANGFTFVRDAGSDPWASILRNYDGVGSLDYQNTKNDDGTRIFQDYDNLDNQVWSSITESYSTSNQLASRDTNFDATYAANPGGHSKQYFDHTVGVTWSSITDAFSSGNALMNEVTANDDGTRSAKYFDFDLTKTWTSILDTFNAANAITTETIVYDSGVNARSVQSFDTTGQIWTTILQNFSSGGQLMNETTNYDSGVRTANYLDYQSNQTWANIVDVFSNTGALQTETTYFDGGARQVYFNDWQSNQTWTNITDLYDNLNRLDTESTKYDNGTLIISDFDQASAFNWARDVQTFNASNVLIDHYRIMDDGSIVHL